MEAFSMRPLYRVFVQLSVAVLCAVPSFASPGLHTCLSMYSTPRPRSHRKNSCHPSGRSSSQARRDVISVLASQSQLTPPCGNGSCLRKLMHGTRSSCHRQYPQQDQHQQGSSTNGVQASRKT